MRYRTSLYLLLLLLPSVSFGAGFVHRDGRALVDGNGKTIKLNGVNLGGWLLWEGWIWGGKFTSQSTIYANMSKLAGEQEAAAFRDDVYRNFIGENDIRQIAALGMNVVRVPFNHRIFDTASCQAIGWSVLDSLLSWCAKYHVYAVLDMHAAPGGNSPYFIADPDKKTLWKSPEAQARTVALWKQIAARYKDNPWVAGYDLLNEPVPPGDPALLAMYQRIIPAIRSVDKNHLLILEGSNFAKKFSVFTSLPDANMAFSFHLYTWFGGKPEDKVGDYIQLSQKLDVPFWCGEWGENSYEIITNTLNVLTKAENQFSGWCFWTWKKIPNGMTTLAGIQMNEDWKTFMQWCCKPKKKNQLPAASARALMKTFRTQMRFDSCKMDQQLAAILQNYASK